MTVTRVLPPDSRAADAAGPADAFRAADAADAARARAADAARRHASPAGAPGPEAACDRVAAVSSASPPRRERGWRRRARGGVAVTVALRVRVLA